MHLLHTAPARRIPMNTPASGTTRTPPTPLDVLILGGGSAGLWTLDTLRRAGFDCLLAERSALGTGQTIGSQGIIHGGLKYTLKGALTPSAKAIRDMPERWRASAEGSAEPDLSAGDVVRAPHCHLWRTASLKSRVGMVGARAGLRVAPVRIDRADWPDALSQLQGEVFRLDEQVWSPARFLAALARPHADRILRVVEEDGVRVVAPPTDSEHAPQVEVRCPQGRQAVLAPRWIVVTAGVGAELLRTEIGLPKPRMQRRPVHMILVRGRSLPVLNGHCVDGRVTRVTITSDTDAQGRTVWQVGGQVSEDGVNLAPEALLRLALTEVRASLGGFDADDAEWSTYRLDKAEVSTHGGLRPDDAYLAKDARVLTAWPTKLALVPRLADLVLAEVSAEARPAPGSGDSLDGSIHTEALHGWPGVDVALPPWEVDRSWTPSAELQAVGAS
ncbi:MAG: FAD-dependent oxidoreductase [Planctomycetota bacterium]